MRGLYVVTGAPKMPPRAPALGALWADARGPLASRATAGEVTLFFEGILTADRREGTDDAAVALDAYRRGGVEALRRLEGFYQVALLEPAEGRATIVGDAFATRPHFLYEGDGVAAMAPSPTWLARAGLAMHLDRLGLYQLFRLHHGLAGRTMTREVTRHPPQAVYSLERNGTIRRAERPTITKAVDDRIDLERATDRLRDLTAEVIEAIVTHPRLAGRAIHLPLTAGMDSRHILAELMRQGRPPARLHHVRLDDAELHPVERIAADLALPLRAVDFEDLDHAALIRAWVARTAGTVHFHQLYLMGVAEPHSEDDGDVIGFDGYLADKLLGLSLKSTSLRRQRYGPTSLRRLFRDHRSLDAATDAAVEDEFARFDGSERFRRGGADAFNRGPGYTGSVFPVLGDHALYFAPAAHARALDFFRAVPEAAAADKRARRHLFRRDFPTLGAYPGEDGATFGDAAAPPPRRPSRAAQAIWAYIVGAATWHRIDPTPDTPHAWLRQIPALARAAGRATRESALARDGHLPAGRVRRMWRWHRAGALLARPLMSLITAEVAYRTQVLGEPAEDVAEWLTR